MLKQVLISYHIDDRVFKNELKVWLEYSGFATTALNESKYPLRNDKEEENVARYILLSDIVCILIGRNVSRRPWINFEIRVAENLKRPLFLITLPSRSSRPPQRIRTLAQLPYDKQKIKKALTQL